VCKCVLPPADNPIAVNKYIIISNFCKLCKIFQPCLRRKPWRAVTSSLSHQNSLRLLPPYQYFLLERHQTPNFIVFWNITPCSFVDRYLSVGETAFVTRFTLNIGLTGYTKCFYHLPSYMISPAIRTPNLTS
jgi:hypothetical protein